MNIFTIFFYKILAKYSPKCTKLHNLKKNFGGACPRTTLATKNPRNEILDTPLHIIM